MPNSQRVMELKVNDFPISEIKKVDITIQKTITITHGSYSGAIDPIPDSAVLEIIQIKQGNSIGKYTYFRGISRPILFLTI